MAAWSVDANVKLEQKKRSVEAEVAATVHLDDQSLTFEMEVTPMDDQAEAANGTVLGLVAFRTQVQATHSRITTGHDRCNCHAS